ncbi:hypothetical protein HW561_03660 [Rhodobacteraceae bacterium B1Z28]|uniref:Phosphoadenosine phosphosulfate reductase n=1 Tax=Ruegeria haliotis TaxID=2747601 RepID=A0ABX2PL83_9RHOB|nr:hypothetical protein [Ruegeria haliotis]NVO54883.1 hypothetical protein [Ruegeria haliotis]
MADDLPQEQLKPEHPDRKTGYERILTDPAPPWFVELYPGGDGTGFLQKLERHAMVYHQRDLARLVVSFDNIANVNDLSFAREPWGWKFFRDEGWSHLGVVARTKAWYRDPEIISYFQDKAREGFFERFDQVVFAGASMGGFGALVFSSVVPGSTVIAFNPQTTLDERIVPWETRYRFGRVQDWDLSLGDAAEAIRSAGHVYVFYDPFFDLDRLHASRLQGPNVLLLKTWFSNHFAAPMLRKLNLLKPVMQEAMAGTLNSTEYYEAMRKRRGLPLYMRGIEAVGGERHPKLVNAARHRFRTLRRQSAAMAAGTT